MQAAALNPDNPTARDLAVRAKSEIDAGHLNEARQLLRQATQAQVAAAGQAAALIAKAQEARDAQLLGAAVSTAAEGDVALTERHYPEAASLFNEAASYAPPGHPDEHAAYLSRQADALYRQGDERGNNAALLDAIATHHAALAELTRDRVPLQWAGTQMNFGNALRALGERESGTGHLTEAVAAYRAALEENTRDRVPLQWARTQINLGNALETLGERESGTGHLTEAVAAYRAALEEETRDRVPLDWAGAQMGLSTALRMLAKRENSATRLREAITCLRSAAEEYEKAGETYWLPEARRRLAEMNADLSETGK